MDGRKPWKPTSSEIQEIIFTVGLVTLRQLRGEGPDPLAQLDSYIAGIIQTVWVMPPLLGDGNWAVLGMMTHLPTDMEIEDAQRDCGTRRRKCRWKATETSVEAEPSPTDSGLSPLSHNGAGALFLVLFSCRVKQMETQRTNQRASFLFPYPMILLSNLVATTLSMPGDRIIVAQRDSLAGVALLGPYGLGC